MITSISKSTNQGQKPSKTVLIIEQDPIIAACIEHHLEQTEFDLFGIEENYWEAICAIPLNQQGPDIVLMHCDSRESKQIFWICKIVSFLYSTQIVILTTDNQVVDQKKRYHVLQKPFTLLQLSDLLRRIAGQITSSG